MDLEDEEGVQQGQQAGWGHLCATAEGEEQKKQQSLIYSEEQHAVWTGSTQGDYSDQVKQKWLMC